MSNQHRLDANPSTVHRGVFDARIGPVIEIAPGDTVVVTSLSGSKDQLPLDGSRYTVLPEHRAVLASVPEGLGPHFMTGPIAIRGAEPGDELVVDILSIDLNQDWGWNLIYPGKGTLPNDFTEPRLIHVAVDQRRRTIKLPWGLEIKAKPFFGIIGVAPPPGDGARTSVVPGAFGGNIDNRHLGAGATLHLPIFNRGALLSVGDGHAIQGDGEVCLTAIETGLRATLRLSIQKGTGLVHPWAETPSHVITMGFDEDLDAAAEFAVRAMVNLVIRHGLSAANAYTLCSIAGDVHVTQLVNVSKGIHVMLAKDLLAMR